MTGTEFAEQARSDRYTGISYSTLDCQAFVERVLIDCGVRKPDGSVFDWKGSNSMWRNALSWKGTLAECREKYGSIPLGAWVFIVKNDGGEVDRGYHDDEGNATHVGIYCREGETPVRDSTRSSKRDGVGYRSLDSFNMVGLPKCLSYGNAQTGITREEALKALETLTKYVKGV